MFSRQPIPYPRSGQATYLRQLGYYAFTKEGLDAFRNLEQGPLEQAEEVEMLRLLEHGTAYGWSPSDGIAVDTPEDLVRAGVLLKSAGKQHQDR